MTAKVLERNTEKFNDLPDDFKEAIRMSDFDITFDSIVKKHKLHIDQSSILEVLLSDLIFGEIDSIKLISEMETKIGISNHEALEITKEMNDLLITPIKDNLKKIQTNIANAEEKEDEEQ